jgi:phosphoinositide-3-kinase regulatory subunit 4
VSDGTDPNIIHFLEVAYLDSLKESAHDFGPRISPAAVSSRRKASASRTTVGSRASSAAQDNAPFSFLEAGSPVVSLAASPDQIFFVTTHRDNSLRVWDSARLERNVSSKPRLVHQLGATPTALCFVEDTHCLAVASADGTVVVLRVHISSPYSHPKFREVELVRFYQCETAGDHAVALNSVSAGTLRLSSLLRSQGFVKVGPTDQPACVSASADGSMELVLATLGSSIVTLDLCSMRVLKTLRLPLDQGPPSCVYADRGRQWVAVGTSIGVLSVWDARFGLSVRTWSASTTGRVRFCLRHPLKSRWVLVAAESAGETYLQSYEVESGRLMESFTTSSAARAAAPSPGPQTPNSPATPVPPASDADVDKAMAQLLAARSRQRSAPPLTPVSAVLAIAVQPRAHQSTGLRNEGVVSGPTVFTAGLSGQIRCLNFADLQRSRMLALPGSDAKISYSCVPCCTVSAREAALLTLFFFSSLVATRPARRLSHTKR